MNALPDLSVLSVKVPVSDLAVSRRWYADVYGLREEIEWPDDDGTVRGVTFSGLGTVLLALRQDVDAATATRDFGIFNVRVAEGRDLSTCADHLDGLGVPHTPPIPAARGMLIGFHDPDGHELSFYAETHTDGVRPNSVRHARVVAD